MTLDTKTIESLAVGLEEALAENMQAPARPPAPSYPGTTLAAVLEQHRQKISSEISTASRQMAEFERRAKEAGAGAAACAATLRNLDRAMAIVEAGLRAGRGGRA